MSPILGIDSISPPNEWGRDKLARLCRFVGSGGTPSSSNPDFYGGGIPWVQTGDLNDASLSETSKTITEEGLSASPTRLYPPNTLLMAMYGATIGKLSILQIEAAVNQACCGMVLRNIMDVRFMFYKLLSMRSELIAAGRGGGQQNISQETVKQSYLTYPRLAEQQRIAAYLDASCAAIDAAVAAKRRQLETLDALRKETITRAMTRGLKPNPRTKPSGEDWLGEIPTHWSAPSLKRLLREPLTYGLNEAAELEERDLPRYLRITDFDDDGKLRDETFRSLPWEIAREALLEPNDVLFARSGATVGKTFMFRNYEGEACFAGYLICARTRAWELDPLFLYLFTKSTAYESWKNLIFTQATIQNISATKYNYLAIPLPPLDEQRAIVAFVEEKNSEFRSLQVGIETQITTLTAYRKSLIHECVTGQRQITAADLNHVKAHG